MSDSQDYLYFRGVNLLVHFFNISSIPQQSQRNTTRLKTLQPTV